MEMQRQFANGPEAPATHARIRSFDPTRPQNFSNRLVEQALADGWMQLEGDRLTVVSDTEGVQFTVRRGPGYYCASTGEQIPISQTAWGRFRSTGKGDLSASEAKAWLASRGRGLTDYEIVTGYECVPVPATTEGA
jgi:hypothetical protein